MAEGLTKGPDEIYCPECGRTILRGKQQCPLCDTNFRELFYPDGSGNQIYHDPNQREYPLEPVKYSHGPAQIRQSPVKSKVAAVLLAVFFGYWSWLYTYGKNKLKFWVILGIFAIIFIINFSFSFSIIMGSLNTGQYGDDYFGSSFMTFIILVNIINFGVWVWSVIDNAAKPESFYGDYPNG